MGWMTFVTPILVCSLGGLAQAEARGADVSWEVWEVFRPQRSYLGISVRLLLRR